MRFSLIMPTKNRAHFILRSINSLLQQDFSDWELLVGDSSDVPVKDILPPDPRIKYEWLPPGKGAESVNSVCNHLFAKAQGDIRSLLPDDDLLTPGALTTVERVFREHRCQWFHSPCEFISLEGQNCGGFGRDCSLEELAGGNCISGISTFWTREAQTELGEVYQASGGWAADYEWNLRLYWRFGRPPFLNYYLAQHTVHPDRTSSAMAGEQLANAAQVSRRWQAKIALRNGTRPLRVMLNNRDPRPMGGDMVQVYETRDALKKIGVEATFSCSAGEDLSGYDLVHMFHMNFTWSWNFYQNAKRQGKPLVISSIFYPTEGAGVSFAQQKEMAEYANALISLSSFESGEIRHCLGFEKKITLIPNGVSNLFLSPGESINPFGEPFIMSAGRMEHLKGHLRVLDVAMQLKLPIVIAGGGGHPPYLEEVKAMKYPRLVLTGEIPQEELVKYYRGCHTFVMASHSERMTLTALEAGATDANLVVTKYNGGNEWMPGLTIADALDRNDLIAKAEKEFAQPRGHARWQEFIQKNLTWDKVAEQVKQIYLEALA